MATTGHPLWMLQPQNMAVTSYWIRRMARYLHMTMMESHFLHLVEKVFEKAISKIQLQSE